MIIYEEMIESAAKGFLSTIKTMLFIVFGLLLVIVGLVAYIIWW